MSVRIRSRAIVLIVAQVLLIATSVFWEGIDAGKHFLTIFYTTFFCVGGYAMVQNKQWLKSYVALAVGSLLFGMLGSGFILNLGQVACAMLAHILLFKAVIEHSFFKTSVPKLDRILSGVAGYILVGLFWANLFMFLGENWPGSVLNQVTGGPTTRADELYYGFVTITSLGYGDIVPANSAAKVVATFAGLSGVLYTAIFISALISGLKIEGHDPE